MATTAELINLLRSSYPSASVGPDTVRAYVRLLADVPPEELEPVVLLHVRTQPRFPTVSELASAVVDRRLALPAPDEAWERVSRYLFAPAGESRVEAREALSAPERAALEAVGGWYDARSSENPSIVRAQFLKAYEAKRRREVEQANLGSLAANGSRALAAGAPGA